MSTEWVMLSNHLVLYCPLLLLPSIFPSIKIISSESALPIRWPKYGASASASRLPMNIQGWFPLRLTGLISLLSEGPSRVFSSTTILKHQFFGAQPSLWSNSHIYTGLLEVTDLTIQIFVSTIVSLFLNKLSRFVIAFLPRRKEISWLQSPSARILELKKIKSATASTFLFAMKR